MNRRKIDIVPFGGLGNRMRVMNSAFELNKLTKRNLNVAWLVKPELNAKFQQLFSSAGFDFELVSGLKYKTFLLLLKHIYIQKYTSLYRLLLKPFYDLILFDDDVKGLSKERLLEKIGQEKKVLIATCYSFFPFDSFDNFVLSGDLRERLNNLDLPTNLTGIHIRRSDHASIIQESSIQSYDLAIEKEIAENPNSMFYLATDDNDVKEYYRKKLGNALVTLNIELSRSAQKGIEDAVLEVYSLSKCSKLICNSNSSFAILAQKIGDSKLIIEV